MMKSIALVVALAAAVAPAERCDAQAAPLERLAWLAGCWSQARADGPTKERSAPSTRPRSGAT